MIPSLYLHGNPQNDNLLFGLEDPGLGEDTVTVTSEEVRGERTHSLQDTGGNKLPKLRPY